MWSILLEEPMYGALYWKREADTFVEAYQFPTCFATQADAQVELEARILPDLATEYRDLVRVASHAPHFPSTDQPRLL